MTIPEPEVRVTRYQVSCLPPDSVNASSFTVHVKQTRDSRWVATDGYLYLNEAAEWVDDPFGANCRYDEETALRLAKAAAPLMVTFNGYTVADALARAEGRDA